MPNFGDWIYVDTSFTPSTGSFIAAQAQQQYEAYQLRREQEMIAREQAMRNAAKQFCKELREKKEREADMEKFPLFFWKETCKKEKK